MKRLMLGLCLLLLSGCAVYKDKDGVTHYELLPPAPAVYYGADPYYGPPAYYYGPYPYYYQGYYYGPGHYRWYWR